MTQASSVDHSQREDKDETRRDFLYLATAAAGVVGTGLAVRPPTDDEEFRDERD